MDAYPTQFHLVHRVEFDYKAIAFLYEGGAFAKAFEAIEDIQVKHRDLIRMDKQRTETASVTQRMVADATKAPGWNNNVPAEDILGPAFVAELDMLCVSLVQRAEENEKFYLRAFQMLRGELLTNIKQTWNYRVGYLSRLNHDADAEQYLLQLNPRLSTGFNMDELPALPANLKKRVGAIIEVRKSAKQLSVPAAAQSLG